MKSVFISYSHADSELKERFLAHLASLKRQELISVWHDRMLEPGTHLNKAIELELSSADLVILLISSDFIQSDYCSETEMIRAFERYARNEAKFVALILRPCRWRNLPLIDGLKLGDFLAIPRDGKAVTDWKDTDSAFEDAVTSIERILTARTPPATEPPAPAPRDPPAPAPTPAPPTPEPRPNPWPPKWLLILITLVPLFAAVVGTGVTHWVINQYQLFRVETLGSTVGADDLNRGLTANPQPVSQIPNRDEIREKFSSSERLNFSNQLVAQFGTNSGALARALIDALLPGGDQRSYRINLYVALTLARIPNGWPQSADPQRKVDDLKNSVAYPYSAEPTFAKRVREAIANRT